MNKNKKSKAAQQTQLLMEKAKIRKAFFANLREVCWQMVGPGLYEIFTMDQLEEIFSLRFYGITIHPAEGHRIGKGPINELRSLANDLLQEMYITMADPSKQVSIKLFFEEGVTLLQYAKTLKMDEHPNVGIIKNTLAFYDYHGAIFLNAIEQKRKAMLMLSIFVSDMKSSLFLLSHTISSSSKTGKTFNQIFVSEFSPEVISVSIENNARPVYRVYWPLVTELTQYATITPLQLGLEHEPADLAMPVYVQAHALHRLEERIGSIIGLMHFCLVQSVINPIIIPDSEDKWLIEYRIMEKKIGYLVAKVVDQKVIVLTFLFLTSNGTPEGKKLAAITGLNKLDKKYLAIDKLKSFVASDIKENEKIKEVFIQAGCNTLFEFEKSDLYFLNSTNETNAALLLKYLNLSETSIGLVSEN